MALGASDGSEAPLSQAGFHQADTACPISADTWESAYWSAQTATTGADAIAGGENAAYALSRPPGHHAYADLAGGFCFLNNSAIAADVLARKGLRPAILDVDVHHGNGTQGIFYRRSDVLTVSIHADPIRFYPFFWGHAHERGEGDGLGYNLNLPLPRGSGDDDYMRALDTALAHIAAFGTDVVVHDSNTDQISVTPDGVFDFEPLAENDAGWISSIWFGEDHINDSIAYNALISTSPTPYAAPHNLYWTVYSEDGTLLDTFDFTPPLEDDGACIVVGRSPDGRAASIIIDAELDGIWNIWVLPLDPPGDATQIENHLLPGLPAINASTFLWAHMDNQRVSYRKELLPNIFRPVAVDLSDLDANPRNIGPTLPHVYSIVWSDDDTTFVASSEGANDFRVLHYVRMEGPTDYTPPIQITEDAELGLTKLLLPNGGPATPGHGFDAKGRVWYAFNQNGGTEATGMMLASVSSLDVVTRKRLGGSDVNTVIDDIVFDAQHQILAYRVEGATTSWVNYVDLSADDPRTIRVNQNFTFAMDEPDHSPRFGFSGDGRTIAVAGIQSNLPVVHVAQVGDPSGNTIEIAVPDVERNSGAILDFQPRVAPNGDQLLLWYRSQTSAAGLIHAPTDGTPAEIVLTLQHPLIDGVFIQAD